MWFTTDAHTLWICTCFSTCVSSTVGDPFVSCFYYYYFTLLCVCARTGKCMMTSLLAIMLLLLLSEWLSAGIYGCASCVTKTHQHGGSEIRSGYDYLCAIWTQWRLCNGTSIWPTLWENPYTGMLSLTICCANCYCYVIVMLILQTRRLLYTLNSSTNTPPNMFLELDLLLHCSAKVCFFIFKWKPDFITSHWSKRQCRQS